MNYQELYAISAQGMHIEKLRLDIVAYNIANQHSLSAMGEKPFQPLELQTSAVPFIDYLQRRKESVYHLTFKPQDLPPNKVYQPEHPSADQEGYVSYPGIDSIHEMTNLLQATRAYEANLKIFNTAHSMHLKTLTIGER